MHAEPPLLQLSFGVYEGVASDEVQNRAFCNLADEKLLFGVLSVCGHNAIIGAVSVLGPRRRRCVRVRAASWKS